MYFYAKLNEEKICTEIQELHCTLESIPQNVVSLNRDTLLDMVTEELIPSSVLGKQYVDGEWIEIEQPVNEITVQEFYIDTKNCAAAWERKAPVPAWATYCAAAYNGQDIIVAYLPMVAKGAFYNIPLDCWQDLDIENMNASIGQMPVAEMIGNSLYLAGNSYLVRKVVTGNYVNSPTWEKAATLPFASNGGVAGVIDKELYIAGSGLGSYKLDTIKYTPSTNTWNSVAALKVTSYRGVGIVYNNEFYVFGGAEVSGQTVARKYNKTTNTWTNLNDAPVAILDGSAFSRGSNIYVTTGGSNEFYVFNTITNTWAKWADIPLTLSCHTFVQKDDSTIFSIGGSRGCGYACFRYNVENEHFLGDIKKGQIIKYQVHPGRDSATVKFNGIPIEPDTRYTAVEDGQLYGSFTDDTELNYIRGTIKI